MRAVTFRFSAIQDNGRCQRSSFFAFRPRRAKAAALAIDSFLDCGGGLAECLHCAVIKIARSNACDGNLQLIKGETESLAEELAFSCVDQRVRGEDIFVNWKTRKAKLFRCLREQNGTQWKSFMLLKSLTDRPEGVLLYTNKVHDLPE